MTTDKDNKKWEVDFVTRYSKEGIFMSENATLWVMEYIRALLLRQSDGIKEKVLRMKEHNVCTCDRKICHCGKFPTAKEGDAWNAALDAVEAAMGGVK